MLTIITTFVYESSGAIFLISAIIGTMLFIARMCFVFIGDAFAAEVPDTDHLESYADHHHDEVSFKMLTVHSMAGFFMTFGWVGYGLIEQYSYPIYTATSIAISAGMGVMLISTLLMKYAKKLESSGTVFNNKKALNIIGTVYQRIPENGQGKILIVVDGITRELLAQSHDNSAIESFQPIKVINTIDHEIVQVKYIQELHHD